MATEAAAQGGGGGGFIKGLLFGAALGGGSMYAYNAGMFDAKVTQTVVRQASVDYKKVREEVAALLQEDDNRGPLLVRLAWHASGTYDKNTRTGGSNGATMRFKPESDHGANAGLQLARALLEPIKQRHPGITYADLWTLAGAVSIEELGGPAIPWRPGRKDAVDGSVAPPDGRLPDAAQEQNHIRAVFGRMGFNDREMVALIGAHTLGRCHTDRSGYTGPWTRAPTTFSNLYFKELVENKWTKKKWSGPEQFEDPTGDLMMLPTDMALLHDPEFRKISKEYAADEEVFYKDFASAFSKLMELGVPFETAK